jgi:hypothetical protein
VNIIPIIFLVLLMAWPTPASAVDTLRPEQLRPGMKGYGLSVFKGTKPERFEVEIVGVLNNAMPKQDMILIRPTGQNLEKHRTVAGMSGSPIYIDGKLIGALAYGWNFETDPLVGVTPIHNMLAEINKPIGATPAAPASAGPGANNATARPLLTPLSLGGFSPRTIAAFAGKFNEWGFLPVAVGNGGSNNTGPKPKRRGSPLVAGSSIGVDLIRGDISATAVGTATYVDKNKILAFGHPFMSAGQFTAPAVEAEVVTIMSSMERSFKMANAGGEIGAMIGDWQSCIVADTTVVAPMIPVALQVVNRTTGDRQTYRFEVVDHPALSSRLILMGLLEAIGCASGSADYTTVHMTTEAELTAGGRDRTLRTTNTFLNIAGLVSPESFDPIIAFCHTPFGDPRVRRVTMAIEAVQQRQSAEIKRAYFHKAEVERGEHAELTVVLKPFGQPEISRTIPLQIPSAIDQPRQYTVAILAGGKAPPDIAPPDTIGDHLDAIEKQHRFTDLVILVPTPSQGLRYRGKLLKNLPASTRDILNDHTRHDVAGAADIQHIVVPTDWVLSGQTTARVPIRQE